MTMVIHGGGEGVYEEGEDDEKEPLVLRVERVKAPQPHQGILRVRLYAVGQGDVLGEEENLWHEEVVVVPFRHFLHAMPRHGEKYLGTSVLRLMILWTHFLSASMRASRCSTATSCGIFFSMQICLRYRLTLLVPAPT